MYKLFLCLRYLLHRRIAVVPVLAVMLCVAMNLIVVSVMGGFLDAVRTSVRGLFGDVIITENSLSGFGYYDTYADAEGRSYPGLLQYLADVPEIAQATPVIETYAMLRLPNRKGFSSPVKVLGIIPGPYAQVTSFQEGLFWQLPTDWLTSRRGIDLYSEDRPRTYWQGLPSFELVPDPFGGRTPVPLKAVAPGRRASTDSDQAADPVGVVVGVRVFWGPDRSGHYPRQMLKPGTEPVQLTFLPLYASGVVHEQPVMRQFHLVDTSCTRIAQIDQATAYVPFSQLQQYLEMGPSAEPVDGFLAPARTTRVLVKLADGVSLDRGRDAVQAAVDRWLASREIEFARQPEQRQASMIYYEPFDAEVLVWEQANRDYFSALENQKFISVLMVGIVSLTVVALIWVIFIMIVVEKTKDIGIIKSVGGSAGGVAAIFLSWAGVIGLIGSTLGGVLGFLFVHYINPIERWLSYVLKTELFSPQVYLFDRIPARFCWGEMAWIAGGAIAAAMLGAVLPAFRAARMDPVKALQYE